MYYENSEYVLCTAHLVGIHVRELAFSAGGNALRALVLRMTGEKDDPLGAAALDHERYRQAVSRGGALGPVGTWYEERARTARLRPVEGDVIEPLSPKMASKLGLIGNGRRS